MKIKIVFIVIFMVPLSASMSRRVNGDRYFNIISKISVKIGNYGMCPSAASGTRRSLMRHFY